MDMEIELASSKRETIDLLENGKIQQEENIQLKN